MCKLKLHFSVTLHQEDAQNINTENPYILFSCCTKQPKKTTAMTKVTTFSCQVPFNDQNTETAAVAEKGQQCFFLYIRLNSKPTLC